MTKSRFASMRALKSMNFDESQPIEKHYKEFCEITADLIEEGQVRLINYGVDGIEIHPRDDNPQ